jgi:ribosomal protein L7/L12
MDDDVGYLPGSLEEKVEQARMFAQMGQTNAMAQLIQEVLSTPTSVNNVMWTAELEVEVKALAQKGLRIEAIRLIREKMNLQYLNEARQVLIDFEERMRLQTPDLAFMPPMPDDLEEEVRKMLPEQKIAAIKRVREETGWGLKEAKDAVEDLQYNRTPWPDNLSWFVWSDVRRLIKDSQNKAHCMKLIRDELGVETEVAFKLIEAIKDGRIKEPPRPPKYRSIDDE